MALPSSSRNGARVDWAVIHSAEGARTIGSLFDFFNRNQNSSSHAGADGYALSGDWVDINRAAWTLLNGNARSVNLELCAFARWTREQWLSEGVVDGVVNPRQMIRHAAAWTRRMCDTFDIPKRKLTPEQVARGERGVIAHWDYTLGARDGDHTDVGRYFPWDVFFADMGATSQQQEDDLTPEQAQLLNALKEKVDIIDGRVEALIHGRGAVEFGPKKGERVEQAVYDYQDHNNLTALLALHPVRRPYPNDHQVPETALGKPGQDFPLVALLRGIAGDLSDLKADLAALKASGPNPTS